MEQPVPPKPSRARSIVVDGSIVGGASLLVYGAWAIFAPAGFIVAGLLLLSLGIKAARA